MHVVEVRLVKPKGSILLDVDQMRVDEPGVAWLSVWRQPHELVFSRVHLESGVVGERGVQQSDGMREMDLALHLQLIAIADRQR